MRHRDTRWSMQIPLPMCRSRDALGQAHLGLGWLAFEAGKVSAFIPQGKREIFELRTRRGCAFERRRITRFECSIAGCLSELRFGIDCGCREFPYSERRPSPNGRRLAGFDDRVSVRMVGCRYDVRGCRGLTGLGEITGATGIAWLIEGQRGGSRSDRAHSS